jgi:uncharacterized protein DUF6687
MQYVPYHELEDRPNIIVDGAANAHTSITLSHWPRSATPDVLKDDLSAQIVFRYLDHPEFRSNAEVVSNNHFDEDGLIGIYAVLNPSDALRHRDLLIDIAAAGDFGTYRFREAARADFVLSAFADPDVSPLGGDLFKEPYPKMAARLYWEVLPRLPEIVMDLDRFRGYWEAEDAMLAESEEMLRKGAIRIEETPELDLAVVTLPEYVSGRKVHRFTQNRRAACHPMALHNMLHTFRVLLVQGNSYEFQYRYESWVHYVSRRPLPRVDLRPLARRLSEMESGNGRWVFDGVDEITPKLALENTEESRISQSEFVERVKTFLAEAQR